MNDTLVKKRKSSTPSLFLSLFPILAVPLAFIIGIIFVPRLIYAGMVDITVVSSIIPLQLPAYILLPVYIYKYYPQRKKTFLLPLIFLLLAAQELLTMLLQNLIYFYYLRFHSIWLSFFLVLPIRWGIMYALPICCAVTGLSRKKLYVIGIGIAMLMETISFLVSSFYSHWILNIIELLFFAAHIVFLVNLLLFGLRHQVPDLVVAHRVKRNIPPKNAAQALKELNYRLDCGMISPEAYQQRRAAILQRLMEENQ